jgi:hypothetical protein
LLYCREEPAKNAFSFFNFFGELIKKMLTLVLKATGSSRTRLTGANSADFRFHCSGTVIDLLRAGVHELAITRCAQKKVKCPVLNNTCFSLGANLALRGEPGPQG